MFKKILVPLDRSELAEKILPHVEDLAKIHEARITLLTVGHFLLRQGHWRQPLSSPMKLCS